MAKKLNKSIGKVGSFGTVVKSSDSSKVGKRAYVPAVNSDVKRRKTDSKGSATKSLPNYKKGGSHPGFKSVQNSIASKEGVSKAAAGAILASATRKASSSAKKANPRLKRVKGK